MIWKLALEQLRANRTYTVWITALLTVLVGVLTYVATISATQAELPRDVTVARGTALENRAEFNLSQNDELWEGVPTHATPSELLAMVDRANASGARATLVSHGNVGYPAPTSEDPEMITWNDTLILAGDVDWGAIVVAGREPRDAGEIVLAANIAEDYDVGLGDSLDVFGYDLDEGGGNTRRTVEVTVVGLSASTQLAGFDIWAPGAYLSWDEFNDPEGLGYVRVLYNDGDATGFHADATTYWSGPAPELEPYRAVLVDSYVGRGFRVAQSSDVWVGAAATLFVAMIVMAFAVGRSQAAARTRWIATARTLGATKRHVILATIAETALVAIAALAAGLLLGWGAAAIHLAAARASTPYPLGPSSIAVSWLVIAVPAVAAALVAGIVAAVPAFWGARVQPVAALKPVSDVTEGTVSRNVKAWWLWGPLGLAVATLATVVRSHPYADGIDTVRMLTYGVISVAGMGILVEFLRHAIPAVARRLARSSRPAAIAAGEAMIARPRHAVAPAVLWVVAIGFVAALFDAYSAETINSFMSHHAIGDENYALRAAFRQQWGGLNYAAIVGAAALVFAVIQLVASAIFTSLHGATARESAAARAMGLRASGQRLALTLRQWLPQAIGALVGVAATAIAFVGVALVDRTLGPTSRISAVVDGTAVGSLLALGVAAAGLTVAWFVSYAVAATLTRGTPVGAAIGAHS